MLLLLDFEGRGKGGSWIDIVVGCEVLLTIGDGMLATEDTVDAIESLLLLFTDGVEALTLADLTEGDRFDGEGAVVGVGGNLPRGVIAAGFGVGGDASTGNLLLMLLLLLAMDGGWWLFTTAALSFGDLMLLGGWINGAAIGIVPGSESDESEGGGLGAFRGFSNLLASLMVKLFLLSGEDGVWGRALILGTSIDILGLW